MVINSHKTCDKLNRFQSTIKRVFDILISFFGLIFFSWVILLSFFISTIDTRKNGFYTQKRIGKNGKSFLIIKIRTMKDLKGIDSTITSKNDPRITKIGSFFRKYKIDELPQLVNIFIGDMSFVGPRPDVKGYADRLQGEERIILSVRPGVTGPATIKYREEEHMLSNVDDKYRETYNKEVIFADKVKINIEYVKKWSFSRDLCYIWQTLMGLMNNG